MKFKDQVDFVRQHIKKNKLRVFMTVLAATMGTAFLIILASVGFGLHDTIRNDVLSNRLVTEIQVYSTEGELDESQVQKLRKKEHVKAVISRRNLNAGTQTKLEGFTGSQQFIVTDFVEEGKVNFELQEGRLPKASNEVVVGSHFAETLSKVDEENEAESTIIYNDKLLGKQFNMSILDEDDEMIGNEMVLTIVGIGKKPAKEWNHDQNIYADMAVGKEIESIYYSEVERPTHPDDNQLFYSEVRVYGDDLENVKALSKEIEKDGYSVYSIADELEQLDVFFLALKAGLVFVGTIAILISSIGIFNTMTMAVTERTREIGVMKAIGAKPKLIQRLFLMESAWIGILGTFLAVVISYGVSILSNFVLPIIVTSALGEDDLGDFQVTFSVIPWQLVVIASVISIGVAMISGWRPARKATKIDVINALRQEL